MTNQERGINKKPQGCKSVFNQKENDDLKDCIELMAELGFLLTLKDVGDLVESHVSHTDHERAKKILKHKGRIGYPGPDWARKFMDNNNLSLKEATKLSVARYNATKNPFVINHFYDMLENVVKKLGIENRPDLIWNADESGMPHEPKKCRIVSVKGQKTLQVIFLQPPSAVLLT